MLRIPYRERVWMNWWLFIFLVISILLLSGALLGRGLYGKPIEPTPVPSYGLLVFDLLLILLVLNFRKLDVEVSPKGVETSYGILKGTVGVDDIVSCKPARTRLPLYGGLGLRLGANDWPGYKAGNAVEIIGKAGKSFVIPTNKPAELSKIINDISKLSHEILTMED